MSAVDVGIGHDNNLIIAKLRHVRLLVILLGADSHAKSLEHIHDFLALIHLVIHGLLHIQNLSAQRQDSLIVRIASLLG